MSSTGATALHPFEFKHKRALIYGAARGIGRAVALEFARRGAQVAIADIDHAGAEDTTAAILAAGARRRASHAMSRAMSRSAKRPPRLSGASARSTSS